jgi:hypothetical protein
MIRIVFENILALIVAVCLYLVTTTAFETVVVSILIFIYAEIRRSRLASLDAFFYNSKLYIHLLKVVETTFNEHAKQNSLLAKTIKNAELTADDIPDHQEPLDLVRGFEEVESIVNANKEYRKTEIVVLIEQIFLCILCLLALWKILRAII